MTKILPYKGKAVKTADSPETKKKQLINRNKKINFSKLHKSC